MGEPMATTHSPTVLAAEWQRVLASGECASRAALARRLGATGAGITQVLQRHVRKERLPSDGMGMGGEPQPSAASDPVLATYCLALPRVYGYLLARCGSAALAEDLTGETLLAAVDASRRGGLTAVSTAWLVGVARHKLVDHWRRREREQRGLAAAEASVACGRVPVGPVARVAVSVAVKPRWTMDTARIGRGDAELLLAPIDLAGGCTAGVLAPRSAMVGPVAGRAAAGAVPRQPEGRRGHPGLLRRPGRPLRHNGRGQAGPDRARATRARGPCTARRAYAIDDGRRARSGGGGPGLRGHGAPDAGANRPAALGRERAVLAGSPPPVSRFGATARVSHQGSWQGRGLRTDVAVGHRRAEPAPDGAPASGIRSAPTP
jgi:Sigma-70 region 2